MRSHSQEEPSTFLILCPPPNPHPPWRAPLCSIFSFLIASEKLESEYARKLRQKPTQEKNGQRRGEGEALRGKGEVELGGWEAGRWWVWHPPTSRPAQQSSFGKVTGLDGPLEATEGSPLPRAGH